MVDILKTDTTMTQNVSSLWKKHETDYLVTEENHILGVKNLFSGTE